MAELIGIDDVKWDPKVYPRQKYSTATIERYADAMVAGDQFPALVLEEGTNRLLDGKHRLEAYKLAQIAEILVEHATVPGDIPVKLFAASLSARHGDRLSNADSKDVCREVYLQLDQEKAPSKTVAKMLGLSESTVSSYVSDLVAKRREERRAKALRLSLLGWTVREIGERLGISKSQADEDLSENFINELSGQGHTSDEIALRLGLPVQVVKAIQLKDASDPARMKALNINIQPYDVWHFQGCHDLMGDKHPGRIPGELICHVLYFYTKSGELVVDPMVGSGTTLDACLLMGRKARGYEIDLHHERIDIEQHDLSGGWPETVDKAKLIFWDPPYFDKKDGEYADGSISAVQPSEYLDWLAQRFDELYEQVKPGTKLAFLMSDWDPENAKDHKDCPGLFQWDYVSRLQAAGWGILRQIQVPLSTQQVHPDIVNKFREARRLARLGRYLLVAEK